MSVLDELVENIMRRIRALEVRETRLLPQAHVLPSCAVYNSLTPTILNVTWTLLTFDGTWSDQHDMHNPGSNPSRITIPADMGGLWLLTMYGLFAAHGTGERWSTFRVNGSDQVYNNETTVLAGGKAMQSHTVLLLTAGQYVEAAVYQNSGASLTFANSKFTATRLSD